MTFHSGNTEHLRGSQNREIFKAREPSSLIGFLSAKRDFSGIDRMPELTELMHGADLWGLFLVLIHL